MRRCQQAIREEFATFSPPGLDEFLNSEKEQTNLRAKQIIDRIELALKNLVTDKLRQSFSTDSNSWWQEGVPKTVRLDVTKRQESDDNRRGAKEAYFDLIDYRNIALSNWLIFNTVLGFGKKNESKDKQTKWIVEVNEWRNQVAHASSGVNLHIDSLARLELYAKWLQNQQSTANEEGISSSFSDEAAEESYE
jgi:DNA sulfur modification protein DndB